MERLDERLTFLDPRADIAKHGAQLPHWQQPGATYFVTFRLNDSIPQSLMQEWKDHRASWIKAHPKPWSLLEEREYHRRFLVPFDRWLDQGHGSCLLRNPVAAETVRAVLNDEEHNEESHQHQHHSWVVMPNHVHLLFSLSPDRDLEAAMKAWKGASARRVNQALQRGGKLWMKHYFDRMIRDAGHFKRVACYIRRNPEKAGLREREYLLYESELVREVLAPAPY